MGVHTREWNTEEAKTLRTIQLVARQLPPTITPVYKETTIVLKSGKQSGPYNIARHSLEKICTSNSQFCYNMISQGPFPQRQLEPHKWHSILPAIYPLCRIALGLGVYVSPDVIFTVMRFTGHKKVISLFHWWILKLRKGTSNNNTRHTTLNIDMSDVGEARCHCQLFSLRMAIFPTKGAFLSFHFDIKVSNLLRRAA